MAEYYNQSLKERYIEFKMNDAVMPHLFLQRIFGKTKSFEEELNKDVSNFTVYEIMNMLKTFNITSRPYIAGIVSSLRMYTDWSINNGLVIDSLNHYNEITPDDQKQCLNIAALKNKIVTEETIEEWINTLSEPVDKFVLRAAFEGISGRCYEDLTNLKITDFTDHGTVKLFSGKEVKVSKRLYELAKASSEVFEYTGKNGEARHSYDLFGPDLVVKYLPQSSSDADAFRKGRRIYLKLRNIFNWVGVEEWMNINDIVNSGRIKWLQDLKKKGIDIEMLFSAADLSPEYEQLKKEFEDQFSFRLRRSWFVDFQQYL